LRELNSFFSRQRLDNGSNLNDPFQDTRSMRQTWNEAADGKYKQGHLYHLRLVGAGIHTLAIFKADKKGHARCFFSSSCPL
jgi:hypothetical protein